VTNDENGAITAEGLAAEATTWFEMGGAADVVRSKLVRRWEALGSPGGAFGAAAEAVSAQPQPIVESVEESERARPMRALVGVTEPEKQLLAALRARELLEDLAREHG